MAYRRLIAYEKKPAITFDRHRIDLQALALFLYEVSQEIEKAFIDFRLPFEEKWNFSGYSSRGPQPIHYAKFVWIEPMPLRQTVREHGHDAAVLTNDERTAVKNFFKRFRSNDLEVKKISSYRGHPGDRGVQGFRIRPRDYSRFNTIAS